MKIFYKPARAAELIPVPRAISTVAWQPKRGKTALGRPRVCLLLISLALVFTGAGCATVAFSSRLQIEPGKQYLLNISAGESFTLKAENTGPVPVEIMQGDGAGEVQPLGRIEPSAQRIIPIRNGSVIALLNRADQPAQILLTSRDVSTLEMRYEVLPKD